MKTHLQTITRGDSNNDVHSRRAVVVLPPAASLPEFAGVQGRWLTRGSVCRMADCAEPLASVLEELGAAPPAGGLAALRLWGQTGCRPADWVSAADPVYLEAMLDHVRLRALDGHALLPEERRELFEVLQRHTGDQPARFELVGNLGYLRGGPRFATADRSPLLVDTREPDQFLPSGPGAREHDRLIGELQMLLHASTFNRNRASRGLVPVNSIWFWGGGEAPPPRKLVLPVLIADDALLKGFWQCAACDVSAWPDDPVQWLESIPTRGPQSFVAVVPVTDGHHSAVAAILSGLKRLMMQGTIRRLSLICRDGWLLRLNRPQMFAFWRGRSWPDWPGKTQ